MVLIVLLQLQTRRQLTLATKKNKVGMISKIFKPTARCVAYWLNHSVQIRNIWAEKQCSGANFRFLVVNVVLTDIRSFKWIRGWFSPVFVDLDRSRSITWSATLGMALSLFGEGL